METQEWERPFPHGRKDNMGFQKRKQWRMAMAEAMASKRWGLGERSLLDQRDGKGTPSSDNREEHL